MEDDDDDDDEDNDYFNDDFITKPVISSSSESSTSPFNEEQKLSSISPSISVSLSNETKSLNSCLSSTNKESASPLSHEHVLVAPLASKISNNNCKQPILPLNPNYLAADIVSLSSLTSNYSQFDFINDSQQQQQQNEEQTENCKKSNSTFSAFFNRFTSSNKNKNIKNLTIANNGLFSGAFKLFQSANNVNSMTTTNEIKVTKSSSDYTVPSSVLILENRPR